MEPLNYQSVSEIYASSEWTSLYSELKSRKSLKADSPTNANIQVIATKILRSLENIQKPPRLEKKDSGDIRVAKNPQQTIQDSLISIFRSMQNSQEKTKKDVYTNFLYLFASKDQILKMKSCSETKEIQDVIKELPILQLVSRINELSKNQEVQAPIEATPIEKSENDDTLPEQQTKKVKPKPSFGRIIANTALFAGFWATYGYALTMQGFALTSLSGLTLLLLPFIVAILARKRRRV